MSYSFMAGADAGCLRAGAPLVARGIIHPPPHADHAVVCALLPAPSPSTGRSSRRPPPEQADATSDIKGGQKIGGCRPFPVVCIKAGEVAAGSAGEGRMGRQPGAPATCGCCCLCGHCRFSPCGASADAQATHSLLYG